MKSPDPDSWNEGAWGAIEQKAAEWLVLRDRGFTAQQQQEFERWQRNDERHAEIYAELDEAWSRLGAVRVRDPALYEGSTTREAAGSKRQRRRSGKIIWLSTGLAAAAAIALAGVTWWRPVAIVEPVALVASTEVGVMRTLPLSDGSVVQLNTDSAISVRFTAAERRVELVRGEAHFQVAKNPARPFIVSAGAVAVRAVGTAFDVRMRPEAVEVLVTEGKVRVDDTAKGRSLLPEPAAGETPLLVAGERAFIPVGAPVKLTPATVATVAASEIAQRLAWQARRLEFVATPLSEMVAEFNRYNRHKLVIADARLAQRRFGGTFSAGDNEELVRLLEAEFGVIVERGADETRLRLAP